jgi:hypothetical protein
MLQEHHFIGSSPRGKKGTKMLKLKIKKNYFNVFSSKNILKNNRYYNINYFIND